MKYKKSIISFILSLIMVFFIWHNFFTSGNSIIFVFILITLYILVKKTIELKNQRANIIAIVIATTFAIVEIICESINNDYTLNNIINKWLLVNYIGYFSIGWLLVNWTYYLLDKLNNNKIKKTTLKAKFFSNNYCFFSICFGLIIIAWIPYLLKYFPGIVTPDSCDQINQAIGKSALSNHHPIAHTSIISLCINLGLLIFNNINIGIALYSILSMMLMACFDAFILLYLRKKNISLCLLIAILLFDMFYPVNALYSISMWKDILFSGMFPLFLILCYELLFNTEEFLKHKRNYFVFIIISFCMTILRHNGLYVVLLSLPFFFIVLKKYWKKLMFIALPIIFMNLMFGFIIFNIIKVEKGSTIEMLSIPLQQIARAEKDHREELDDESINEINHIFIVENIGDYYNPTLSDPVKSKVNRSYFEENKIKCLTLWMKVLLKYPKSCIESFIANSYGYYYPEAHNWVVSRATTDQGMGIEQQPKIKGQLVEAIDSLIDNRDIPILSMLFSIGFVFWIIVVCAGYKVYKKEYKYILVYLPIFILWLTCIASPVFCEFRYIYPMFTSIGFLLSLNFIGHKKDNSQKLDKNVL